VTRHATVSVADCHPADTLAQRYAAFSGEMRTLPGSARMAMRFTLLERPPAVGSFEVVPLPELRPWRRSKPGARTFIYTQRVTGLRDGTGYRARVQFRWYGPQGRVLRTISERSGVCRQPAPLPNLTIGSITSAPSSTAGMRTYTITVANTGEGEAREVGVGLRVDGTAVGSSKIDLLPAQEQAVVQIDGPACAFTVRAVADPQHRIPETNESDNSLTVPCSQTVT
jgi:CARDB